MGNLIQELKRRKVFQVAAIYTVVAWVLLQVADTIAPMMNLPEFAPGFILFLLIILFPVAIFLAWAYEITPDGIKGDSFIQPSSVSPVASAQPINYIILAIVLIVAGFQVADRFVLHRQTSDSGIASTRSNEDQIDDRVTRVQLALPAGQEYLDHVVLSSDGNGFLYTGLAESGLKEQLWYRSLDSLEASLVFEAEADRITSAEISNDGEFVSFTTRRTTDGIENMLGVVPIEGGTPILLDVADLGSSRHAWGDDGAIYWTRDSAAESQALVRWMPGFSEVKDFAETIALFQPFGFIALEDVLPGSSALLLSTATNLFVLNLETNELRDLGDGGNARYLESGHIVFARISDDTLLIQPFDLETLDTTGPALTTSVLVPNSRRGFSIADDGTLIYAAGTTEISGLAWVDRFGSREDIDWLKLENSRFNGVSLAPDGRQIAAAWRPTNEGGSAGDIWILNLEERSRFPLTRDERSFRPQWHPTEPLIVYVSTADGVRGLRTLAVDGSGSGELVTDAVFTGTFPNAVWAHDGSELLIRMGGISARSIFRMVLDEHRSPQPVLDREFNERGPLNSPDGNWLVYMSNRSGRDEVYAQPYPEGGQVVQISSDGGSEPVWSRDGQELFFIGSDNFMWSANVSFNDSSFTVTSREQLFEVGEQFARDGALAFPFYDVAPDGRFLMITREYGSGGLVLVRNWVREVTSIGNRNN